MSPSRHPDWPESLYSYLDAVWRRPFDAVEHNCAVFVRGALLAMTGQDPLQVLGIVMPTSATDVARILHRYGGVAGLADACLGRRHPAQAARRGDILLRAEADTDTLGICVGSEAIFLCEDGLQVRPLSDCTAAWTVPL
jgi:hypothetical protein